MTHSPHSTAPRARGVYAVEDAPPGRALYLIYFSDGDQCEVKVPQRLADDRAVQSMWAWLDDVDPLPKLRVI